MRWAIALAICGWVLAGCGDRRRPVVRRGETKRGREDTSRVEPPEIGDSTARPQPPAEAGGRAVNLGPRRLTAPESWIRKQPVVRFILAEFSLPRAEGDPADGRLTVTEAGGSIAENVARWRGQFGGRPENESIEQVEIAGIQVTSVDISGTYQEPFAPGVEYPDYRVLGAIIPIQSRLYFVKCYGPKKTLAERADEFRAFVRSLSSEASAR